MLLCYSDVGDTKRWWRGCWWQVWPFVATTLKRCHINSVANIQKLSPKPLEPQDFALSWLIKLDNQKITCGLLVIFHLRFFKCCWIAFWRSSSFKNGLSSLQYNRTRCPDFLTAVRKALIGKCTWYLPWRIENGARHVINCLSPISAFPLTSDLSN